jgi:hypothetical protein
LRRKTIAKGGETGCHARQIIIFFTEYNTTAEALAASCLSAGILLWVEESVGIIDV